MKQLSLVLVSLFVLSLAIPTWAQVNGQAGKRGTQDGRGGTESNGWAQVNGQAGKRGRKGGKIFKRMDTNNDRQISREEWSRKPEAFGRLDRNNDGVLTMEELREARQQRPRGENTVSPTKP